MLPYPFSAVVGNADPRLVLLLNAVSPAVGGVLVRGEKGTAKSAMVRALAALLPSVPVVYEPSLLAAAHRAVLYVDEVNLLAGHLVDALLDAAAMGRRTWSGTTPPKWPTCCAPPPGTQHVVVTGRHAPAALVEAADQQGIE